MLRDSKEDRSTCGNAVNYTFAMVNGFSIKQTSSKLCWRQRHKLIAFVHVWRQVYPHLLCHILDILVSFVVLSYVAGGQKTGEVTRKRYTTSKPRVKSAHGILVILLFADKTDFAVRLLRSMLPLSGLSVCVSVCHVPFLHYAQMQKTWFLLHTTTHVSPRSC